MIHTDNAKDANIVLGCVLCVHKCFIIISNIFHCVLVSVLCIPVSSIPTSLSFFKKCLVIPLILFSIE